MKCGKVKNRYNIVFIEDLCLLEYSPLKDNRRFGGTYLQIHGRRVTARNQDETGNKQRYACCLLHVAFLLGLLFNPEDGDMFLRNVG
jgi:hypothetical protein